MRHLMKITCLSAIVMAVCGLSHIAMAAPPAFTPERGQDVHGFMSVQDNGRGMGHFRDKKRNNKGGREERRNKMRERFKNLPPEKQQELQQRREQIRRELMDLSPEERAQRVEQMRQDMLQRNKSTRQERMLRMDERWKNASDEERKAFCDMANAKCAAEGGFVCDTATARCAGR